MIAGLFNGSKWGIVWVAMSGPRSVLNVHQPMDSAFLSLDLFLVGVRQHFTRGVELAASRFVCRRPLKSLRCP